MRASENIDKKLRVKLFSNYKHKMSESTSRWQPHKNYFVAFNVHFTRSSFLSENNLLSQFCNFLTIHAKINFCKTDTPEIHDSL